ncbi:MAG: alanine--tRNA ligase-related protein [Patescibacteria group bacterium]
MESKEIRQRFLNFFAKRQHQVVPSSSLIPSDSSVLLTTAGMQQFKPYYTGAADPIKDFGSKNTVSIQKSFRTSDIDEVGDERHLTFFEMLGNFSFGYQPGEPVSPKGGYGKDEAIQLAHDFITRELKLKIDYVTIFAGDPPSAFGGGGVGKDVESEKIWQSLGVTGIRECGREDNFWGPTGSEGPCGPTTEIYVGGIEIWNLVFNEYYAKPDGGLEKLATLGVDTGMGLERLTMVVQNKTNIFETDLFRPILDILPISLTQKSKRIVADHERAAVFLVADGVLPLNKGAGYVLRRLIRRATLYGAEGSEVAEKIIEFYSNFYPDIKTKRTQIIKVLLNERKSFAETLKQGIKELNKLSLVDEPKAFWLYETYGLPFEVIKDRYPNLSRVEFEKEFERHQAVSRAGSGAKFSGGLADHEPATIKLHTAHHLLLAALQQVLGLGVKQRGSNITSERLRLDFSFERKLTNDEKSQVEDLVNQKIAEDLSVMKKKMTKIEAEKLGAEMEFGQKYGDTVSVYFIEEAGGKVFSKEFCGGPHVSRTGELGKFRILKEEAVAQGLRRIKAVVLLDNN